MHFVDEEGPFPSPLVMKNEGHQHRAILQVPHLRAHVLGGTWKVRDVPRQQTEVRQSHQVREDTFDREDWVIMGGLAGSQSGCWDDHSRCLRLL